MKKSPLLTFSAFIFGVANCFATITVQVSTDREDALYRENDEVTFTITARDGEKQLDWGKIRWTLSLDGHETLDQGERSLDSEKHVVVKGKLNHPGFLLIKATFEGPDQERVTAYGGAGVSPTKIPMSLPVPEDFDEFWLAQKAQLAKSPATFTTEPVVLPDADHGIEAVDINIQCETDGPPVSGYFAKPRDAAPKSLPAVL